MNDDLETTIRQAEMRWLETWTRGPVDVRIERVPVQVGDPAPSPTVVDLEGRWRTLSEVWSRAPAVVVFLRPFGCAWAQRRVERLREEAPLIRAHGASIAVVCQADPGRAAAFFGEQGHEDVTVLCDPHLEAYDAFDIREGTVVEILFDRPDLRHHRSRRVGRELVAGARAQGRPLVDDPWLLAGEFIVDTGGVVRLAYRYQHRCDMPDPGLLLAAVEDLARTEPTSPGGAEPEA